MQEKRKQEQNIATIFHDPKQVAEYTYRYDGNDNQISREGSVYSQSAGKTEQFEYMI